jgi:hypothetical protein
VRSRSGANSCASCGLHHAQDFAWDPPRSPVPLLLLCSHKIVCWLRAGPRDSCPHVSSAFEQGIGLISDWIELFCLCSCFCFSTCLHNIVFYMERCINVAAICPQNPSLLVLESRIIFFCYVEVHTFLSSIFLLLHVNPRSTYILIVKVMHVHIYSYMSVS